MVTNCVGNASGDRFNPGAVFYDDVDVDVNVGAIIVHFDAAPGIFNNRLADARD